MELTVENRLSILARFYFLRPMFCRLYEASKVKKFHSTSNFFLTSEINALECSNLFYESGLFHTAGPDFMADPWACATDPLFSFQWALRNLDPSPNAYRLDLKACDAWQRSTGNDVLVAVIDQGVYLHRDLSANIHPTLRFDAYYRMTRQVVYGDHGTVCAGIIAAVRNNSYEIAGIAPNSIIMPISNSADLHPLTIQDFAWSINQAYLNGADVISCSWAGNSLSSGGFIETAIDSAVTRGRLRSNGSRLGCVVVFSTGNEYASSVNFPAILSNVISVGASTSKGLRWDKSNYGTGLNVVAPGDSIRSLYSTNSSNYFSGTSFAAPYVAGVAALILSYNPNLIQSQVRSAIESSCTKLPSYGSGWNNQVGYGMVNAVGALAATEGRYAVSFDLA